MSILCDHFGEKMEMNGLIIKKINVCYTGLCLIIKPT